ncbi:MAG: GDYXXLXY domain-containing protein [Thermoanaerobaculia bacterium]|nr:GDYXXLXY domain-containing protein [Thermoanaerobaculia bacterium]
MTRRELLLSLGWQASTDGDEVANRWQRAGDSLETPPWFLHLAAGFASFIGALLAGVFFLATDLTNTLTDVALMTAMFVGAGVIARTFRSSILAEQGVWLLAGGSQLLLFHTLQVSALLDSWTPLWFCVVQIVLIAWVPRQAIRMAGAAIGAVCFAVWWFHEISIALDVPALIFAVLVVASFLLGAAPDPKSGMHRPMARLWLPVAFGVALAQLAYLSIHALAGVSMGWTDHLPFHHPLITSAAIAALGVWTLAAMKRELGAPRPAVRGGVLTAVALIAIVGHNHPSLLIALVFLLVGHLRSDRRMEILSLVTLAVVLVRAYYDLSVPLAIRAAWLAATGGLVLGLAWWMSRVDPADSKDAEESASRRNEEGLSGITGASAASRRAVALVGALVLAVAIPALGVWQKERQRDASRVVLLELRPVDPRSWMMGDYMRLAFQVETQIDEATEGSPEASGRAVLHIDTEGRARFERIWIEGDQLAADEMLLRWKRPPTRRHVVDLGMDTFFFREGDAERFAQSRWADVALTPEGEAMLVGVRPVDDPISTAIEDTDEHPSANESDSDETVTPNRATEEARDPTTRNQR